MFTKENTQGFSASDLELLNKALAVLVNEGVDESYASDIVNNNWIEEGNCVESLCAVGTITIADRLVSLSDGKFSSVTNRADEIAVDKDQDWENEATTFIFNDGSKLRCSSVDYSIVKK